MNMFTRKPGELTATEKAQRVVELAAIIETSINEQRKIALSTTGYEFAKAIAEHDSDKSIEEARRELLKLFADIFHDLQMGREWAAITLAIDVMRRSLPPEGNL